ncbi:hypothetical protein DL768_005341 [Monosporascus sp. mg162]|nr:hypothetical protein DL768_005341 [Monosporascus sp. mg162]
MRLVFRASAFRSVAGLISLAIEIPRLIDTAISIRSAPDEAKQLSKTVEALITTLQRLEAFLKTHEARDMKMADDSALIVPISACKDRVLSLSKKLPSHSPQGSGPAPLGLRSIKTTATRFRWPLDKKECLTFVSEIHAMQSTFESCLIIKNCKMAKSHKEVIAYFKVQSETLSPMGASFPDQAAHVSAMLEKIQVVESCVSGAAQRLNHIQIGLDELQKMKNDLAELHADKLHGQALERLSPIDPSAKHEEVRATRLPGTCERILGDADFQRWVKSPPSDDYAGRTNSYSETPLAGAIVRQLLAQFDELPSKVTELARHAHLKLRRSSTRMNEIIQILAHLKPSVQRLFVCVGALDECRVADKLVAACRKFPATTSFIFIGRPSIVQTVKQSFTSAIDRVTEPQDGDVDAVVTARVEVEKVRQPELMPDWLMNEIRAEVSTLANGMFLLASLHTTLVLSHDTIHRRREALKNLPSTPEITFGQSIARIREDNNASRAFKILAWIHLIRPLSLYELRHALAVERHHTQFYSDNLPSSTAVLDCCLVSIWTLILKS